MRVPLPTHKKKARIEIIPLIDIMFFLLATFVLVSLSMVKNQGISVNLPQASTSTADKDKALTTLTVTATNELYFNKDKIILEDLPQQLQQLKSTDADPKILINGDGKALFETAIAVLDEVRKTGITKISIQTQGKTP